MKYPSRPCPICGALDRIILHQQRFYDGVLGDGYDVVVCKHCGAGYADGIPGQTELDLYYAEQSKYAYDSSGGAESRFDLLRFEKIVRQVLTSIRKEAKILDIGCATGGLLSVFKKHEYNRVEGIDPSDRCAEAAQRLYNIPVTTGTLGSLALWSEQYDLITMVGVLEHVREVRWALDIVKHRLTDSGLILIAVPNVAKFANTRNAPYQQLSMEHLNFFSEHSLNNIACDCGLSPINTDQYTVEWSEGVTEPILSSIYCLNGSPVWNKDEETMDALQRYLNWSIEAERPIVEVIEKLVRSGEPIYVWGTGALTRRLLATTRLSEAGIIAFVDSSSAHQKQELCGKRIVAPAQLLSTRARILICSVAFEKDIVHIIRKDLGLLNPITTLAHDACASVPS